MELLTVIAIIGVLAALLLPALEQGKNRAKLIWCNHNLGQTGIAFHSFAHDHNSKFPMQVPVAGGGAEEFVKNGYLVNGEFYFAFRNFQAMAAELVTSKILLCPADDRVPAANFPSLQNSNISYFIGVDADYSRPESILSGDRNLVMAAPGQSIYHASMAKELTWSGTMHQFKGNLLFADGHVEESKGFQIAAGGNVKMQNDFFIPTAGTGRISARVPQPDYRPPAHFNPSILANGSTAKPAVLADANPAPLIQRNGENPSSKASIALVETQTLELVQTSAVASTPVATNTPPHDEYANMSASDRHAVKVLRGVMGWGYLLLLLFFLLWLWFKLRKEWRHWQQRRPKR